MHDFLSDEWITAVREIRARYEEQIPEIPVSIRINQIVTDMPFGESPLETHIDTSSGRLTFDLGHLDDPDTVMETDYTTARELIVGRDPAIVMQAFMAGKIRVQGDMMKLIALQTMIPANEHSDQVADEIAAVTN